MPNKTAIIEEKQFLSDTLSTQVRYITFGALGIVWGFFIGNTDFTKDLVGKHHQYLTVIFLLSILTLVCDYLQYLLGYLYTSGLITDMELKGTKECFYNKNDPKYKLRNWCFGGKQVFLGINLITLIFLLATVF